MLNQKDIQQIKERGIELSAIEKQLEIFRNGIPFLNITSPAFVGNGIMKISDETAQKYRKLHRKMLNTQRVVKFVPASGAATRMFKKVYEIIQEYDNSYEKYLELLIDRSFNSIYYVCENLRLFAFYPDLVEAAQRNGENMEVRLQKKDYIFALDLILSEKGLNYGALPKGLLKFHKYKNETRTAAEEHLVEGAQYASAKGKVTVHFTVSPEHRQLFEQLMTEVVPKYEQRFGVKYQIEFSIQDPSTDTIAVTMDNQPFRNNDGSLLFRPAGHGALLKNLNELDCDIVYIKNIDNVVVDRYKPETVLYKEILGGLLYDLQEKVGNYLTRLENPDSVNDSTLTRMVNFNRNELSNHPPFKLDSASREQKIEWLQKTLNRPIRVCGMVRNEGEPGGGPFWVKDNYGIDSLQIVETSQIDQSNKKQKKLLASSTHFNPVDLVCKITDYKGNPFNLFQFRDDNTGFISIKSKDGRDLKALELPGLWNGAMAYWNTVFVEVPIITFNPVKTINDLIRQEHLYEKDLMSRTKPR
ncbi:MAG TPA: DUF4301 family protein [Salinivirgaceae bacterium]|nr:DUF4301 family protein [Salinivirgaceae bacterium]